MWAFKRADGVVNELWADRDEIVDKRRGFGSAKLGSPQNPGWLPVWKVFELPPPDVSGFNNPPPTIFDVAGWILDLPELTPASTWGLQPELKEIGLELDQKHIRPLREKMVRYVEYKRRMERKRRA
jgi:hypothetical protein